MIRKAFDEDYIGKSGHAYLIGIGGVGMSALARVLKHRGLRVSGSDKKANHTTAQLQQEGIQVHIGQERPVLEDSDIVIYSSAINQEHPEMKAARSAGVKIYHRAQILSSILNQAKTSVAVTGTHGKTTTSSMISLVLAELGKNPTCLVGGDVLNLGTNTVLGDLDLLISEVDESDQTHELYAPNYAIMTNLEEDHLDHYKDLDELKQSFTTFVSQLRNPGMAVYSAEDAALSAIVRESGKPAISFGFSDTADFAAANIQMHSFGSEFDLLEEGFYAGHFKLSVPGHHNIANALAAIAVLIQLGIDPEQIASALCRFKGARRRLEIKFESRDLVVIDDYAHHPTEVKASIRALRSMGKHLTVVFQPHRFSRTKHFCRDFGRAFDEADDVILTDIYSAGEKNDEQVGIQSIYNEIVAWGHGSARVVEKNKIIQHLVAQAPHGIVAFLGAGDIGEIADEFANRFKILATA